MAHQSKRGKARLLNAAAMATGCGVGLFGLVGFAQAQQAVNVLLSATTSDDFIITTLNTAVTIPAAPGVSYDAADVNDNGTIWNSLFTPNTTNAVTNNSGSNLTFTVESSLPLVDSQGNSSAISLASVTFTENNNKNDTIHSAGIINTTTAGTDGLGANPGALMNQSWFDNGNAEVITFNLTGLAPSAAYNLYIYGGGQNFGYGGTYTLPKANQPAAGYLPVSTDSTDSGSLTQIYRSVFDSSGNNPAPEKGLSWNLLPAVSDANGDLSFNAVQSAITGKKGSINGFQIDFGGAAPPPPDGSWIASATPANWSDPASWQNGAIPNNAGATASFAGLSTQSAVTLDGNFTVGGISFNNTTTYSIAQVAVGTGTLVLDSGSSSAAFIISNGGAHSITVPIVLNSNLLVTGPGSGNSVSLSGGISSAPGTTTGITVAGSGSGFLSLRGTNNYTGATIINIGGLLKVQAPAALPVGGPITNNGSISIQSGSPASGTVAAIPVVTGAIVGTGSLVIGTNNISMLQIAPNSGASTVSSVAVQTTAGTTLESQFDLTNNRIVVNYGAAADPVTSIAADLTTGYNAGTWTGLGITSSSAAANPSKFAVGYLDGNTVADTTGGHVAANQMIIAYTLAGDAFLENSVGFDDLVVVAQNFGFTGKDWAGGNFNYDPTGAVGFPDLVNVAQNFGFSSGVSEGSGGTISPAWLSVQAQSTVPEPASISLILAGAAGLLTRRRPAGKRRRNG